MGTEYTLAKFDHPDYNNGFQLLAYEMSGCFDIYSDVPKKRVDMDAWENEARVDFDYNITPDRLLEIGLNICKIARENGAK